MNVIWCVIWHSISLAHEHDRSKDVERNKGTKENEGTMVMMKDWISNQWYLIWTDVIRSERASDRSYRHKSSVCFSVSLLVCFGPWNGRIVRKWRNDRRHRRLDVIRWWFPIKIKRCSSSIPWLISLRMWRTRTVRDRVFRWFGRGDGGVSCRESYLFAVDVCFSLIQIGIYLDTWSANKNADKIHCGGKESFFGLRWFVFSKCQRESEWTNERRSCCIEWDIGRWFGWANACMESCLSDRFDCSIDLSIPMSGMAKRRLISLQILLVEGEREVVFDCKRFFHRQHHHHHSARLHPHPRSPVQVSRRWQTTNDVWLLWIGEKSSDDSPCLMLLWGEWVSDRNVPNGEVYRMFEEWQDLVWIGFAVAVETMMTTTTTMKKENNFRMNEWMKDVCACMDVHVRWVISFSNQTIRGDMWRTIFSSTRWIEAEELL